MLDKPIVQTPPDTTQINPTTVATSIEPTTPTTEVASAVPSIPPPQKSQAEQPAAPQPGPTMTPGEVMKHHLRGILSAVSASLGGEEFTSEIDPMTGKHRPVHHTTGERVTKGIGTIMTGMAAGMGAHGPGSVGTAAALGAQAVFGLRGQEFEQQQRKNNEALSVYRSHAENLATFSRIGMEKMETQQKLVDLNKATHDAYEVSGIPKLNGATPVDFKTASDLAKGKHGSVVQVPVALRQAVDADGKPTLNEAGQPLTEVLMDVYEDGDVKLNQEQANAFSKLPGLQGIRVDQTLRASSVYHLQADLNSINGTFEIIQSQIPDGTKQLLGRKEDDIQQQLAIRGFGKFLNMSDNNPEKAIAAYAKENPSGASTITQLYGGYKVVNTISNDMIAENAARIEAAKDPSRAVPPKGYAENIANQIGGFHYLKARGMAEGYQAQASNAGSLSGVDKAWQNAATMESQLQKEADTELVRQQLQNEKDKQNPTPEEIAASVDAIGEGRVVLSAGQLRTKEGQKLAAAVMAKYPNYNQNMAEAYAKTRQDFTSGRSAITINAINTTMQHIGRMYAAAGQTTGATGLTGKAEAFLGGETAGALSADLEAIATELTKTYTGGNLTEGEVKGWQKTIDPHQAGMTANKLRIKLREVTNLLTGKIDSMRTQWDNGMPKKADGTPVGAPIDLVTEQAGTQIKAITGRNLNSQGAEIKAPNAPPAGAAEIKAPNAPPAGAAEIKAPNAPPAGAPEGAYFKVPMSDGSFHWYTQDKKTDLGKVK